MKARKLFSETASTLRHVNDSSTCSIVGENWENHIAFNLFDIIIRFPIDVGEAFHFVAKPRKFVLGFPDRRRRAVQALDPVPSNGVVKWGLFVALESGSGNERERLVFFPLHADVRVGGSISPYFG